MRTVVSGFDDSAPLSASLYPVAVASGSLVGGENSEFFPKKNLFQQQGEKPSRVKVGQDKGKNKMKSKRIPYSYVREAALALLIFVPAAFCAEATSQSDLNAIAARQQEVAQTQTAMAVAASDNPTVEAKAQVRSQTETALQDPLENRYSDVRVHDADFNELIVPASKEVLFLKNMVPAEPEEMFL